MALTGFRRLDTAYPFAYTPLVLTDLSDSMNIKFSKESAMKFSNLEAISPVDGRYRRAVAQSAMKFSNLEAISPVDGRYRRAVAQLGNYFSEGALMRSRSSAIIFQKGH
jgi:hypothetical protein